MYWQQHPSTHLHQKPLPQSRRHHRSPRWREAPRRLVKHGGMNQQKWRCRQSYAGEILQWWFLLSWKIENNEAFTSKLSNFWNHHWGDCTNKSGFRKYWFSSVFFYRFKESTKPQLPHQEANKNPQDPCDFPPHNHQTAWNSKMISGDLSGSSPGPKGNVSASKNTRRS